MTLLSNSFHDICWVLTLHWSSANPGQSAMTKRKEDHSKSVTQGWNQPAWLLKVIFFFFGPFFRKLSSRHLYQALEGSAEIPLFWWALLQPTPMGMKLPSTKRLCCHKSLSAPLSSIRITGCDEKGFLPNSASPTTVPGTQKALHQCSSNSIYARCMRHPRGRGGITITSGHGC